MNELEKAIKIAVDKNICEFCGDCGNDDVCIKCKKVAPVSVDDLRNFYSVVIHALREKAEREKQQAECVYCDKPDEVSPYREFFKAMPIQDDDGEYRYVGIARGIKRGQYILHIELAAGEDSCDLEIEHCPKCGRGLVEELKSYPSCGGNIKGESKVGEVMQADIFFKKRFLDIS